MGRFLVDLLERKSHVRTDTVIEYCSRMYLPIIDLRQALKNVWLVYVEADAEGINVKKRVYYEVNKYVE